MKIALLVDELPTGSAPKIIGEESFFLNKLGIQCDAYVLKRRQNQITPTHSDDIQLFHLDDNLSVSEIYGRKIPSFSFFSIYHVAYPIILSDRASSILDNYDAVIVHFASTAIFASRLHLKKAKIIYYYWDPISYIFAEAYVNWSNLKSQIFSAVASGLDKHLLSKPDAIILPSKFHLQRVQRLNRDKKVFVVYPGTTCIDKVPSERSPFIVAVARWEAGKNPFMLINISKKLRDIDVKEFKFKMVGPWRDPLLKSQFFDSLKGNNLTENFELVGPKFGDDLNNIYLNAQCLVHTKTEAFGFPGLEAAAHGCPMVFPKLSGVSELFENGFNGYFPQEGDVAMYAQSLKSLLNPDSANRMGVESWKVAKQHTWAKHAAELVRIASNL